MAPFPSILRSAFFLGESSWRATDVAPGAKTYRLKKHRVSCFVFWSTPGTSCFVFCVLARSGTSVFPCFVFWNPPQKHRRELTPGAGTAAGRKPSRERVFHGRRAKRGPTKRNQLTVAPSGVSTHSVLHSSKCTQNIRAEALASSAHAPRALHQWSCPFRQFHNLPT